jgi:hypothetical protein
MRTLKYTVCSFIGDSARPSNSIDFAVFVVAENEAIILGYNLAAYRIKPHDAIDKYVFENTVDVMLGRIHEATNSPESKTGFDLLDAVISDNLSSIAYRPIQSVATGESLAVAAMRIFEVQTSSPQNIPQPAMQTAKRWQDSPPSGMTVHKSFVLAGNPLFESAYV